MKEVWIWNRDFFQVGIDRKHGLSFEDFKIGIQKIENTKSHYKLKNDSIEHF